MSIAENIKTLQEDKSLMQKEVYNDIGLKPAHYNKPDAFATFHRLDYN